MSDSLAAPQVPQRLSLLDLMRPRPAVNVDSQGPRIIWYKGRPLLTTPVDHNPFEGAP